MLQTCPAAAAFSKMPTQLQAGLAAFASANPYVPSPNTYAVCPWATASCATVGVPSFRLTRVTNADADGLTLAAVIAIVATVVLFLLLVGYLFILKLVSCE